MSRAVLAALAIAVAGAGRLQRPGYAVRPVPRIAADNVGKPVSRLQEAFGEPRKIDSTPTKVIYVWFLPQKPKDGSPSGFHGCEMEVTVDARSQRVLGYSLSNIGWSTCSEVRAAHPRRGTLEPTPRARRFSIQWARRRWRRSVPEVRCRCFRFPILSILIQAALIVHVIKTGRNQLWIWAIALLPGVGCTGISGRGDAAGSCSAAARRGAPRPACSA